LIDVVCDGELVSFPRKEGGFNSGRTLHFSGFAPRENLSHVNFLGDGTLEVVMAKRT